MDGGARGRDRIVVVPVVHVRALLAGAGAVTETIRNRPEARWLPSRHRFALFRLYALLRLVSAKPEQTEAELVLPIERDQSAHEQYAVALWIYVTAVAYVAA